MSESRGDRMEEGVVGKAAAAAACALALALGSVPAGAEAWGPPYWTGSGTGFSSYASPVEPGGLEPLSVWSASGNRTTGRMTAAASVEIDALPALGSWCSPPSSAPDPVYGPLGSGDPTCTFAKAQGSITARIPVSGPGKWKIQSSTDQVSFSYTRRGVSELSGITGGPAIYIEAIINATFYPCAIGSTCGGSYTWPREGGQLIVANCRPGSCTVVPYQGLDLAAVGTAAVAGHVRATITLTAWATLTGSGLASASIAGSLAAVGIIPVAS